MNELAAIVVDGVVLLWCVGAGALIGLGVVAVRIYRARTERKG